MSCGSGRRRWRPIATSDAGPESKGKGYSVWYSISDYCMGMIGNWGIHHLDIAQWGNGTDLSGPVTIEGKGEFPRACSPTPR